MYKRLWTDPLCTNAAALQLITTIKEIFYAEVPDKNQSNLLLNANFLRIQPLNIFAHSCANEE
jgi:hypothetical protein